MDKKIKGVVIKDLLGWGGKYEQTSQKYCGRPRLGSVNVTELYTNS